MSGAYLGVFCTSFSYLAACFGFEFTTALKALRLQTLLNSLRSDHDNEYASSTKRLLQSFGGDKYLCIGFDFFALQCKF